MSRVDPKVLERIKKCMRLSASSEPHEAAAALRQAQKLMQIHGLSEADVEVGEVVEGDAKSVASATRQKPWEGRLASRVTEAFGLVLIFVCNRYGYGSWRFIGPATDVAVAMHIFVVLQRQCASRRSRHVAELRARGYSSQASTANGDLFALAWVDSVQSELDRFTMSPARKLALESHMARKYGETKEGRSNNALERARERGLLDHRSALAGEEAGKEVRLRRAATADARQALTTPSEAT